MKATTRKIAAACACAAMLLAGCGDDNQPALEPDHAHGPPVDVPAPELPPLPAPFENVDQYSPEAVMEAAVETMFSWRPATDASPADAAQRARPLMEQRYYERAHSGFLVLAPVIGSEWDRWKSEDATDTRVEVEVTSDRHTPDQQATHARVLVVTADVVNDEGDTVGTKKFTVYASVSLMGVWRLSDLSVQP